eukprot:3806128-Pleurochrysis_carterae.AAC.1
MNPREMAMNEAALAKAEADSGERKAYREGQVAALKAIGEVHKEGNTIRDRMTKELARATEVAEKEVI